MRSVTDGPPNGILDASKRKKLLGQYFSGPTVSRLLVALCDASSAESVLDPMAGTGDLLAACAGLLNEDADLAAIEIDPGLAQACKARLPRAKVIQGNAFDLRSVCELPRGSWSRTLANPPYVRYQSLTGNGLCSKFSNPLDVRTNLIEVLQKCSALQDEDRAAFTELARNYSGLSDLAVPSVILCAAFTAENGRLGLVMPESWLTRDYAAPIRYLLSRWFQIEAVIEDADASWFETALVRTTLVIARRVKRKSSAQKEDVYDAYPHVRLSGIAADSNSLVGRVYPHTPDPDVAFAKDLERWRAGENVSFGPLIDISEVTPKVQAARMMSALSRLPWLRDLEPIAITDASGASRKEPATPLELLAWMDKFCKRGELTTLSAMGIEVGQGLRTGANEFFYATKLSGAGDKTQILPSRLLNGKPTWVNSSFVRAALRRQSELPIDKFVVRASECSSVVLTLSGAAMAKDRLGETRGRYWTPLDGAIEELIEVASKTNFGTQTNHRYIWELSAVAPNLGRQTKDGSRAGLWYHLPPFSSRHTPDIAIPRVNNHTPLAYLNEARSVVIDANFSGIWLSENSSVDEYGLLAFFHSTWARVAMELSASILGGGAAKLEATQIRWLPIPARLEDYSEQLSNLGRQIVENGRAHFGAAQRSIDKVMLALFECTDETMARRELMDIAVRAKERRAKRRPAQ